MFASPHRVQLIKKDDFPKVLPNRQGFFRTVGLFEPRDGARRMCVRQSGGMTNTSRDFSMVSMVRSPSPKVSLGYHSPRLFWPNAYRYIDDFIYSNERATLLPDRAHRRDRLGRSLALSGIPLSGTGFQRIAATSTLAWGTTCPESGCCLCAWCDRHVIDLRIRGVSSGLDAL